MKPNISEEDILRALEGKPMRPMEIVHALGLPRTYPGERYTMLTTEIVSGQRESQRQRAHRLYLQGIHGVNLPVRHVLQGDHGEPLVHLARWEEIFTQGGAPAGFLCRLCGAIEPPRATAPPPIPDTPLTQILREQPRRKGAIVKVFRARQQRHTKAKILRSLLEGLEEGYIIRQGAVRGSRRVYHYTLRDWDPQARALEMRRAGAKMREIARAVKVSQHIVREWCKDVAADDQKGDAL